MLKQQNPLKAICMAVAALTAFSCSEDDLAGKSTLNGNTTIVASFEGAGINTRTSVNESNEVVWNKGDAFGLFYTSASATSPTVTMFTCTNADGTSTSAAFNGPLDDEATTTYAVYPYQKNMCLNNSTVTMKLSNEFEYTQASNGPMYAPASDITQKITFKHLAGLLKLTVSKGITSTAKKFVITANKNIAGTCTADLSGNDPALAVTEDSYASKTITISLNITDNSQDNITTFYVPIPVGTYATLSAKLLDNSDTELYSPKEWTNITVTRAGMLTASFGFVTINTDITNTSEGIKDAIANALPSIEPATETTTDIQISGAIDATQTGSGISSIEIPTVQKSNVNLTLATVPTTSETAPLVLKDNNASETTPDAAINTVTVAIPKVESDQTAPNLIITLPKTTVELDAVSEEGTTYGKVTAKTANNTLIIKHAVTIKELVVEGGNVRVAGKVEKISKDGKLTKTVYLIKEEGAEVPTEVTGFTVIDAATYDMKAAFADGKDYTLTADASIIGASLTLPAGKTATLDLNGHTLTAANKAGDNIMVYGKLTLQDNSTTNNGKIVVNHDYSKDAYSTALIYITGENASMTMTSGNINAVRATSSSNGIYGVGLYEGADFTMTGGKIEAGWYAVSGNGTYKTQNSVINIKGGELISTADYAVYLPQAGTTTISGGKINGAAGGVAMQNGVLNISDKAEILSTDEGNTGDWSDGTGNMGNAALVINAGYGNCEVNITGGTISALNKAALIDATSSTTYTRTINISGGTFSDPSALVYLADNANVNVTLTKDCETTALYIPGNRTVTMDLNQKKLTVKADKVPENITIDGMTKSNANVLIGGSLTLKNGSIENNKKGMALVSSAAKLELDGITYTTTRENHSGIFNDPNVEGSAITVKNSTIISADYAITTNALTNPVGSTTIELENSTFTASETALMVNIPSKITVKDCTFNGGWQGVFLRGGTATFTNSHINLVFVSSYATSNTAQGNTWASGNQAPAAALTAGNRSNSAYDYKTEITLNNTTFSNSGTDKGGKTATDFPAIYIDTESVNSKPNQGVELTYDTASKTSFDAAGKGLVIGNKDNVKVNGSTPQ